MTRRHARSFSFASVLLRGPRRQAAYALYAFCRRLDDLVDTGAVEGLPARLEAARRLVSGLYARPRTTLASTDWPEEELAVLVEAIERFDIPEQPFQDLISGMEMDLVKSRYATWEELDLYCYRVAGTVGLLMAPVLGAQDARASAPAAELGKAMQLTNILRDVREDLGRGRIYLPTEELAAFGVDEAQLAAGKVDARFEALMRFQIDRARSLYARGEQGLPYLPRGSQRLVRLMSVIYSGILGVIEARRFDVFSTRARVSLPRKLLALLRVLFEGTVPTLLTQPGGAAVIRRQH